MNWILLKNSLVVSLSATLTALLLGFLAALWAASVKPFWRGCLLTAGGLALALPPFLSVDFWLYALGFTGAWKAWLPVSIYSSGGAVWILALLLWPIPMFASLTAWRQIEQSQLESESALHGGPLLRWLLWPVAAPALAQAGVITFVLALNNFAVPAILQIKVFPAEVWLRFSQAFDSVGAFAVSWPLIVAPLLLLWWFHGREVAWPRQDAPPFWRVFRRQLGAGWFWSSGLTVGLVVLASIGLPLIQTVASSDSWKAMPGALAAGRSAFQFSFVSAAAGATLTVVAGLASWRLPLGLPVWLPFLAPGVLLGIAMIVCLNRPPFIQFYQSPAVVIFALSVRYLPIGWHGARLARRSVDPELTDSARLCGASRWALFCHVHWPQMAPKIAATWYITYLLCLWDVETLVLVMPPGFETLPLRIFNLLHYGHNVQVSALCLLLLGLAVLPLLLWGLGSVMRGLLSTPPRRTWLAPEVAAFCLGCLLLSGCSPPSESTAPLASQFFSRIEVIGSRGTGPGQFNKPRSVAVDGQDNLFVVDMTGRVQRFSPKGEFVSFWQMPQTDLGRPKGMSIDGAGRLVVLEPHYSRVNCFSSEGKLQAQWGTHGTNTGQLAFPRAIAFNSKAEVFVSEYGVTERVQRFSPDGSTCLGSFGRFGAEPGEFNRAEGLGMDAQDQLHVADSCNHRIQVFTKDGKWLRSFGRPGKGPGELSYPYDVRVDAEGNQYVCEFGNSRIQVFNSRDQSVEIIGGPGTAPGQFSNPWSIALDQAGNLYVADAQNHRVQKLLRKGGHAGDHASSREPGHEARAWSPLNSGALNPTATDPRLSVALTSARRTAD